MKGKFYCRVCGQTLTGEIAIHSLKDPNVVPPDLADQQPVCAAGKGFKSYQPLQSSFDPNNPDLLEFAPQFWLNPADIEESGKLTKTVRRLGGCCGLAGCNGPNIECRRCGTEIGTKQSDCWAPLIFVPDPNNTEFRKI
jgi:hypothetical protein